MCNKTVLALDLGLKTGYAIAENGKITKSGVWKLHGKQLGSFINNFRDQLSNLHLDESYTIYYEDVVAHKGTRAAHIYGALKFTLLARAIRYNMHEQVHPVGVKVIKKFITGNGNATKYDVIGAVRSQGFNPQDDNEADAIALAMYGKSR